MLVTPFPSTAFLICDLCANHGTLTAASQSGIAPVPETVSVPSASSVHVSAAPQLPETVSSAHTDISAAGRMPAGCRSIPAASKNIVNCFCIFI